MNNLYGWAMSSNFPYGGLKWLKYVDGFDVNSVSEKNPIGYILEVDFEYPDELHVLHNDYPLAPETLAISYHMLPYYCKTIADKSEIKFGDVKKLITNLVEKTNYVFHYRNLRLYLSLGMKLTIIHKNLSSLTGWKNISVLTLKKEQMLLINSVYEKTITKKNECQGSKQQEGFFKIHLQINSYYSKNI